MTAVLDLLNSYSEQRGLIQGEFEVLLRVALASSELADTRAQMSKDAGFVLLGSVTVMSMLSVRQQNRNWISTGLVGLSTVNLEEIDERDVLAVLPLLFRASQVTGFSFRSAVESAANSADGTGKDWLMKVTRRGYLVQTPDFGVGLVGHAAVLR
jgi:hypothetical protein